MPLAVFPPMSVTSKAAANPDETIAMAQKQYKTQKLQSAKIKPKALIDISIFVVEALFFILVEFRLYRGLDFFVERLVVFQNFFGSVTSLHQLRAFVVQPGAALLDNLFLQSEIEKRASQGYAFVVHDVELGFGEWRRDFVFHDFETRAITGHDTVGLLDRADAADIDAHARVKF